MGNNDADINITEDINTRLREISMLYNITLAIVRELGYSPPVLAGAGKLLYERMVDKITNDVVKNPDSILKKDFPNKPREAIEDMICSQVILLQEMLKAQHESGGKIDADGIEKKLMGSLKADWSRFIRPHSRIE